MIPEVLNIDVIDEVITVGEKEAYEMMKSISTTEGIIGWDVVGCECLCRITSCKGTGTG